MQARGWCASLWTLVAVMALFQAAAAQQLAVTCPANVTVMDRSAIPEMVPTCTFPQERIGQQGGGGSAARLRHGDARIRYCIARRGSDRPLLRGRVHADITHCLCYPTTYKTGYVNLTEGANPVSCAASVLINGEWTASRCLTYIIYSPGEMHALSQQQPPALAHGCVVAAACPPAPPQQPPGQPGGGVGWEPLLAPQHLPSRRARMQHKAGS